MPPLLGVTCADFVVAIVLLAPIGGNSTPFTLFVAISPGLPRQHGQNHIRELAVHLSGLNSSLVSGEGSLLLARDDEFRSVLKRFDITKDITDNEDSRTARIFTGYVLPPTNFSMRGPPDSCLGYFVRFEWRNRVIGQSCLKVYPNWLGQLVTEQPAVGNLTLNSLAIPGSHNAGAYKVYTPGHESFVTWYRDCQEENVYSQLLYGSRFLDIRPGLVKGNHTRTFWVFHSSIRTDNTLERVLKDVRRFLSEHKREVVFIDFHEFPWGFKTASDYTMLGDFVEKHLGPYMLRYRPHMITLTEAVALNQRAVVTFEQDDVLARKFLPGVNHAWANTDNLQELKSRLQLKLADRSTGNRLYSAMAQLTPQGALSIIFDKYHGGVRGLSHRNNIQVMSWWKYEDDLQANTNIIAVDYFTSTDVVGICKALTIKRALDLRHGYHHYR